jgi:transposase
MTQRRYALRDDQWDRMKDLLPGRPGHVGVTARDNRLFVEAVIYRYRAGIPWRDLPERFGDFRVAHTRFSRWARTGIWKRVFETLAADADNEYAMLDSTIVRAHQHRAGAFQKRGGDQAIGRSKGGLSTKIHARTDALGNPTGFELSAGQASDLVGADHLLPGLKAEALLADKAFDADERVLIPLEQAGIDAVIPPKRNRVVQREDDRDLYKARHLIENFFQQLKQYRAIATRYDKLARNFLAGIHLASACILLA